MLRHPLQAEFVERRNCINCNSTRLVQVSQGKYDAEPLAGFIAADPWGVDPLPCLQTAIWDLVECSDCGQLFHRRILNEEWNERRFTEWMSADAIKTFEARLGPAFDRTFHKAASHVVHILRIEMLTRNIRAKNEAVRLLDFGCGFGSFLEACRNFGFDACGVDRSVARRQEASLRVIPSLAELEGAPKFHAITLFEVLEHLDDPARTLRQLSSYLVEGGVLILETPDCSGVTDIKTHSDYLKIHPLEHINAFTYDTLKSMAERCGHQAIPRRTVHVTSSIKRAIKTELKYLIGKGEKTTQLYFRKI
jgi:2-polyprenyl-3-methyl-5-hydroxy-6-metoxy-1,4-benzoquinol methylase